MSACLSIKSHGGSFLIFKTLKEDIQTIFAKDPVVKSTLELEEDFLLTIVWV